MNKGNLLKLLRAERAKILGFAHSHLRSVRQARNLERGIESKVLRSECSAVSPQTVRNWIWELIRRKCLEMQRLEAFQFRVLDDGALDFLDQNLMAREGRDIDALQEKVRRLVPELPTTAQTVLRLFYQKSKTIKSIARSLKLPTSEVYQIWQHSLLFLWEGAGGDVSGSNPSDDESFWARALRYLDGSASEPFVADLNREIHLNCSRTREYNNLRIIDGILIHLGANHIWLAAGEPTEVREFHDDELTQVSLHGIRRVNSDSEPSRESAVESFESPPSAEEATILAREMVDRGNSSRPPDRRKCFVPSARGLRTSLSILKWSSVVATTLAMLFFVVKFSMALAVVEPPSFTLSGLPRVIQAANAAFDGNLFSSRVLPHGEYDLTSGVIKIHTNDGISLIIEAPSDFKLHSDSQITLKRGRIAAYVPPGTPNGMEIETSRFHFRALEGEIGVLSDENSVDLLVFTGEGELDRSGDKLGPGMGLRFYDRGKPDPIYPRDEAHRYPETLPAASARTYGDNLVVNPSFEIGPLSRSSKTERLYRDIPLGWTAAVDKDGSWRPAAEQHSGTVRVSDSIGGLPRPVEGERYLWINHGFIFQELVTLVGGARYELIVNIGSQNSGRGLEKHDIEEQAYRFGVWSGTGWIAELSGKLQPGQPFTEMKLEFVCPLEPPLFSEENRVKPVPGKKPSLMLTGETRVFYDQISLRLLDPMGERLVQKR